MTKINYPQRLAVSLTQEQYDKLQHLSEEKSVSMANLVRAALKEYLDVMCDEH